MPDFDKERALREEIAGLGDIVTSLGKRSRALEQQYAEVEVEFNAIKKLLGFAQAELERKRAVLQALMTPKD